MINIFEKDMKLRLFSGITAITAHALLYLWFIILEWLYPANSIERADDYPYEIK
jgi:hypothetical protein